MFLAKDLRVIGPNGQAMSIEDYNIPNEGNLTLVCRLRGGSNEEPVLNVYDGDVELAIDPDMPIRFDEEDGRGGSNEEPVLKVYDGDVELTTEPDMFTLDDEEDGQRAKMPCGHAISTTLLVLWVFNAIFNKCYIAVITFID